MLMIAINDLWSETMQVKDDKEADKEADTL